MELRPLILGQEGGAEWEMRAAVNNILTSSVHNQLNHNSLIHKRAKAEEPFMFKMVNRLIVTSSLTIFSPIARWEAAINKNEAWSF